jgi:hypothetical protein
MLGKGTTSRSGGAGAREWVPGRTAAACAVLALLAAAPSCKGNSSTTFPDGLEPLDAVNQAHDPAPLAGDAHPEALQTATGDTDDYSWAHGRGYVHASLTDTWAAMRDPDTCVDRRSVDEWTHADTVDPKYRYAFSIHNVVHSVVTVEFDVTWREDVAEGTVDAPSVVAARWQKVYGTNYITLMGGSIIARRVDDATTELELVEHLNASGKGSDTAETTMRDWYGSVVAKVHGRALPTY